MYAPSGVGSEFVKCSPPRHDSQNRVYQRNVDVHGGKSSVKDTVTNFYTLCYGSLIGFSLYVLCVKHQRIELCSL